MGMRETAGRERGGTGPGGRGRARPWTGAAALLLGACLVAAGPRPGPALTLAADGRTPYTVAVDAGGSETERFAAAELSRYLERMSGAPFPVAGSPAAGPVVALRVDSAYGARRGSDEAFSIAIRGDSLVLTGGSPRAVLYAAYDLLARLGCRWIAPELDFYAGAGEVVPRRERLVYAPAGAVEERPRFSVRKLDVEEGLSHDEASLRRMIEWMPKARFNTLQVPLDYNGTGRVRWDAWRAALVPELRLRGIGVEVGGHGYQNFLDDEMEGGRLFELHPEWFGRDAQCRPSREDRLVFNTEDPGAVAYLTRNVVAYLQARPEITIFDFWPPDGARWAECPAWEAFGTPQDRQARLVNHVAAEVRRARPDVRLEIIAYAHAKLPPETVTLDPGVLVDFCPIGQNFDVDIDDPAGGNNAQYVDAVRAWRARFGGDIGLYSYYRRYAWRSLPVLLPRYIQRDLRWYAAVPLQAVGTYAEPGDWGTYEANHYALAALAWNPDGDVEALLDDYARARFGEAWRPARAALAALEDVVRVYGSVPYSRPRPAEQVAAARAALEARAAELRRARPADAVHGAAAERLELMLGAATRDLRLQEMRAAGDSASVPAAVEELAAFRAGHAGRGVFLVREGDGARLQRHYGPPAR